MKSNIVIGGVAMVAVGLAAASAQAAPQTFSYVVSHPVYGVIGTYERTSDTAEGATRARAHLNVVVRVLGIVVRRETADQTEVWRGRRLMSFQSLTTTDGRQATIAGEANGAGFRIISPSGTATAPADVVASDPWSLTRLGPATVVSIRTGKISSVEVTGGEPDTVRLNGVSEPARHYHVGAAGQANKWEVWIDRQGAPIKFRSQESSGPIDFTLVSRPSSASQAAAASGARWTQ
jgi:hypothetical protein